MSAIPRNEGENFEDYKARRAADQAATQKALAGKLFWDSYYEGTYRSAKLSRKEMKEKFGSDRQFKRATRKVSKC